VTEADRAAGSGLTAAGATVFADELHAATEPSRMEAASAALAGFTRV
jgi:hypothetical protein